MFLKIIWLNQRISYAAAVHATNHSLIQNFDTSPGFPASLVIHDSSMIQMVRKQT